MNAICIQTYKSPVGELLLGSYHQQICMVDWKHRKKRTTIDARLKKALNADYVEKSSQAIEELCLQLKAYFAGKRMTFDVPLLMVGTDFQKSVWEGLMQVPFGVTLSYVELAKQIKNEKAVRAAATANGANALSIVIPCHRIIGSNGDLVGYAGGLDAKKSLLALEKFTLKPRIH